MKLRDVIKKRRSVRIFQKILPPNLHEIIDLARKAPSAGAIRGYEIVITDRKLVSIDAPVYIIVFADTEVYGKRYGNRGKDLYSIQDATIFAAYIQLLLVNAGLASVWIGAFRENKVQKALGKKSKPVVIIALGYE